MAIDIQNDDDLFWLMEKVLDKEIDPSTEVRFVEYPRFEITLRGEDFDGGVPTRIMPALLKFQREIDNGYARALYGEARPLGKEEKKRTELIVRLEKGSTTFFADAAGVLNTVARTALGKMDGPQTLIVLLGTAAMIAGVYGWKAYLTKQAEIHDRETDLELSKQETERLAIMSRAQRESDLVRDQRADSDATNAAFLRRMEPGDEVVIGGERIVDGAQGKSLVRKKREEAVDDRLDGTFKVLTVESGAVRSGLRMKVKRQSDGLEILVSIPSGTLNDDQLADLQAGEWEKAPLNLQMNIRRIGTRVTAATLISAGLTRSPD